MVARIFMFVLKHGSKYTFLQDVYDFEMRKKKTKRHVVLRYFYKGLSFEIKNVWQPTAIIRCIQFSPWQSY